MKVLFLTLYPEIMPSSRYRVYQYIPFLKREGIEADLQPAIPQRTFKFIYNTGNCLGNLSYVLSEGANRIFQLLKCGSYELIFIQKSLTTLNLKCLPYFLRNKKLVFDIDDNVFAEPISTFSLGLLKSFQDTRQASLLAGISRTVIVGNEYLQSLASQFNKNIRIIPTSVDTERFSPGARESNRGEVVIGWIGGPSTSLYLNMLAGVFKRLKEKYKIRVMIIGDQNFHIKDIDCESKPWDFNTEVECLRKFNIGIMPLPDNDWTRGKCGLKALQYMAVGIPVVCSPIGVNSEIIKDGQNGLLASTENEWLAKLSLLIEDSDLRKKLGEAGRLTVEEKYSLRINAPKLKEVIESVYYS